MIQLRWDSGSVVLTGGEEEDRRALPGVQYDSRTRCDRAEGRWYRAIVEELRRRQLPHDDLARQWAVTPWVLQSSRTPFPHQSEAVETWSKAGGRGVVVLPTGTGKTFVAMLAIAKVRRPTLVVTPTIDLMRQWQTELAKGFGTEIGLMGGGDYDFQPITVTTYDSAYLRVEYWGHRCGMLIFDECHHLPGPTYSMAAIGALAPYRMGLTATPERTDGGEVHYEALIGPIVYRREITELSGMYLADYETHKILVQLNPEERAQWQAHTDTYKKFVSDKGISLGGQGGWQRFIFEASRSKQGWEAFQAFRSRKKLEQAPIGKLMQLARLLEHHAKDRCIIFTADNATVYQIARRFFVPAITHQTKSRERKQILERFHSGEYRSVVTSQVLNEGVDVPAASVGIVLSGTSTIRENVQRLGRLLRKHADKRAILYEIVTQGTAEEFSSERRRQHDAFR